MVAERDRLVAAQSEMRVHQQDVLADLLDFNADTAFGKRHDFGRIRTIEEFRRARPGPGLHGVRAAVSVEDVAEYDAFRCPGEFPPYVWDELVPPATPRGVPIRRVHPMTTVEAMTAILTGTRAVHLSFRSLAAPAPPHIRVVPVPDLPAAPASLAWRRDAPPQGPAARLISHAERSPER